MTARQLHRIVTLLRIVAIVTCAICAIAGVIVAMLSNTAGGILLGFACEILSIGGIILTINTWSL